jgi:hypothetical protein
MKASVMLFAGAAMLLVIAGLTPSAAAQDLITTRQLAQSVSLRDVSAEPNGAISATIVNRTGLTVRAVKLMIDYAWVWGNDLKPGEDSPGRTVYITAPAEIPPHGQSSFAYQPSPALPSRTDGHFMPSVHVVGFTQMVPE